MRKWRLAGLLLLCLLATALLHAQGKWAGPLKKYIDSSYADERAVAWLPGWQYREGALITDVTDPEAMISLQAYRKGSQWLVLMSLREDSLQKNWRVLDILWVKNVKTGWGIRTFGCRENGHENSELLAHVRIAHAYVLKSVKQAWRANRDKRRFEIQPVLGIDCLNEGGD